MAFKAFKRFRMISKLWGSQIYRTQAGNSVRPGFRHSLPRRTGAPTGCPMVSPTKVSLPSGASRFLRRGFDREISSNAAAPPMSFNPLNRYNLSRLSPMNWQTRDTFPRCFAHGNKPTLFLIIFYSVVICPRSILPLSGFEDAT